MRISYIPENILKARPDCKFFFRDPFSAAIYNFKVSVHASHIKEHDKFQEKTAKVTGVAKPVIEGIQRTSKISLCNRIAHFLAHVGIGLLLFIPLLNFIPFVILALKAKEHREVARSQAEVQEVHEVVVEAEKAPEGTSLPTQDRSPSIQGSPQPLPRIEVQVQAPTNSLSSFQAPKQLSVEPEDRVLKNLHRRSDSPSPMKDIRNYEYIVSNSFYLLFASEVPQRALEIISKWFEKTENMKQPRELSPEKIQRFFKLAKWSTEEEFKELKPLLINHVNGSITVGAHGMNALSKLKNAETNLKNLRLFLNELFPDFIDAPFIGTYNSTDLRVGILGNPYDRVRKAIFVTPSEDFKTFLRGFFFYEKNGFLQIDPNITNS
jgi:hypothetical protein